jgi:hypothetical protein
MTRRGTLFGLVILLIPMAAAAQEVTVTELIEVAPELANIQVTVEGELIGDYGWRRDGSVWTQLNGDSYVYEPIAEGGAARGGNIGVGVRIPSDLVAQLDAVGGYRMRGPVVRLTGTWKYHDPDRSGESYLDVSSLEMIEPGRALEEGLDWVVLLAGLVLAGAAGLGWVTRPSK